MKCLDRVWRDLLVQEAAFDEDAVFALLRCCAAAGAIANPVVSNIIKPCFLVMSQSPLLLTRINHVRGRRESELHTTPAPDITAP